MKPKPYSKMTAQELTDASKRFDEPFVADQSRPLTPQERAQWNRIKRKRGRPRVGQGFQRISVSIEKQLLKRATACARKRRIPRSKLFALALERVLTQE